MMRIYVYAEHYPSPYKPYFDTQFIQFIKDDHQLRIFANGSHEGPLQPKFHDFRVNRLCSYFPVTLKHLPSHILPAIVSLLKNPLRRWEKGMQIMRLPGNFKERLMNFCRMLRLPLTPPQLCLVHNLLTMYQLRFLKLLYPETVVALYFHGGEIPGVPALNREAAESSFSSADIVFTNTESSKRQAIERGCNAEKIQINPVGFACRDFNPSNNREYRADGFLHLLFLGRFSSEKAVKDILTAVGRLKMQGIPLRLKLVGSGPAKLELRQYVANTGIEQETKFVGPVPYENISEYLEWADAIILSSIKAGNWMETQACVIQEAMLMETIVVTSNTGGVPESIPDAMRRFQYPPGNVSALQRRLEDLACMSGEEMAELGRIGRQFVIENYEIADLNHRLLNLALSGSHAAVDSSAHEHSKNR